MTIRTDETAVFNNALSGLEQRNKNILRAYADSRERVLEKLAKYRQDIAAGIIRGDNVEARLADLYRQLDTEIARLQARVGTQIRNGYFELYGETYYTEAYNFEKSVNLDIPRLPYSYEFNYPVLNTNAVVAAFDERIAGNTFIDRMTAQRQRMRFAIRQAVAENIAEGLTVVDLRKRIELIDDVYAASSARAMTTARTELLSAYSLGQEEATREAEAAGCEFKFVWSSTLDGKVRPTHAKADHQKAIIKDKIPSFNVGGVLFSSPRVIHPANTSLKTAGEVINCRCRRLNIPYGIEPTQRVALTPAGDWDTVPYNTTAEAWYKQHYGKIA